MTHSYTFCIYGMESGKSFTGILGAFTLQCIHLFLSGGQNLIEEEFDGTIQAAAHWYREIMNSQDIVIKSHTIKKVKKKQIVFMEVDLTKTNVSDFTQARSVEKGDMDVLAWKTVWIPYSQETNQECLGFSVCNREVILEPKQKIALQDILDSIH